MKGVRPLPEQSNAKSQYFLGSIYDNGQGVVQDYPQAVAWYRKAADQGNASAQSNLGAMYFRGTGVTQDYVRAHTWRNISASLSRAEDGKIAVEARDALARQMTPAQVARAQEMAKRCLASKYKNCD